MASWSKMSGGARAGLVALGVAGVVVVGALSWRANQPADVPAPVAAPVPADAPATVAPAPEEKAPEPTAAPLAPSFDNWRVEADGSAVVSGRAEPGARVTVLVDALAVADTLVSGSGAFALLFTLPPNDQPSVMTLEATLADGTKLVSDQIIALAPIAGPVVAEVASAEPAAPPAAVVVTEDSVTVVQSPVVGDPAAAVAAPATSEAVASGTPAEEAPIEQAPAEQTPTAPVAAILVDAISYNAAGDVLLSGKGQGGQFVRVYLDNLLTATGPIASSGAWQLTLVDTPPGVYTLRADQIDADGKVTARFETPFQRETREALADLAQGTAASDGTEPTQSIPAPILDQSAAIPEAEATPEPQAPTVPAQSEAVAAPVTSPAATSEAQPTAKAPAQSASVAAPDVQAPAAPAQPALTPPEAPPAAVTVAEAAPKANAAPGAAAAPATPDAAPGPVPATVSITVQPGYTLWGIARASLGDGILYVQVYNANKDKIKNPDLIYPGQVFTLPVQE